MSIAAQEFSETYLAVPGAARAARLAVSQFAADVGAPHETVEAVLLSVSEAVTNSIVHGYRGAGSPGVVAVTGRVVDGELLVTITDSGCGWGVASDGRGLGLGLRLIARYANAVDVLDSPNAGAEVRIHFALTPTDTVATGNADGVGTRRTDEAALSCLSPVA